MSLTRYNSLPNVKLDQQGQLLLEPKVSWMTRRPYPNLRQWSEKTERKTVRDSTFKKRVMSAYKFQCTVCSEDNPAVLIAAHIVPTSEGGSDKTSNGLCLCRNHDILYEQGKLLINEFGNIISDYPLTEKKIRFPKKQKDWPSRSNLLWKFNSISQ